MALIKDGRIIAEDAWAFADAEGALPEAEAVAVPLTRFVDERDALLARNIKLGVIIEPGDDPNLIADDLDKLGLIAVNFPTFGDGRGYTHARLLRERLGWRGELRAIGDVLRDQLLYMARVGIDAFAVRKDHDAEAFAEALGEFSHVYQKTPDHRDTAIEQRHKG